LPREHKTHIFELTYNVNVCIDKQPPKQKTAVKKAKARNDIMNIFTSEDIENMPLGSWMQFHLNFTSGAVYSVQVVYRTLPFQCLTFVNRSFNVLTFN